MTPEKLSSENPGAGATIKPKYALDPQIIDAKFAELLATVTDDTLRAALRARLKRNTHLVVGTILAKDDKICLVQEAQGPAAGKWNLPLGHLEHGESLQAGAKRETKEETGYDVTLTALLPPQNAPHNHSFRIFYLGEITSGSPRERIMTDTSAVGWFTLDEIAQKSARGELRDPYVWSDLLLYQTEKPLPLDSILETIPDAQPSQNPQANI